MAHNEPFSASTHKKIRACHINMGIRVDTKQIKSEQTPMSRLAVTPIESTNKSVETQTEVTSIWECPICMENVDDRITCIAHTFFAKNVQQNS